MLRGSMGASALVLAFLSLAQPALAQDAATPAPVPAQDSAPRDRDDLHNADIVVTAPALERLDLLAGTSAITGDDLVTSARGQIGDTLTSLPGVSATSFSPGASRPVLRGFQGNRVVVLTDGIGTIDASNTSADHAVTLDPLTAERIEVLRGPAVLLFGGQAAGGAVNVLDKRIPRSIPDEPIHIDAVAGYGSAADEISLGASIDAPLAERLVFHVDGSWRRSKDVRTGGYVLSPALRDSQLHDAEHALAHDDTEFAEEATERANWYGRLPNSAVETYSTGAGLSFIDEGGGSLGVSVGLYDTFYGLPIRPPAYEHDHDHDHEGEGGEEGEEHHEHGAEAAQIKLRQWRVDLRGSVELGDGLFQRARIRAGFVDYKHFEMHDGEIETQFYSKGIESRFELDQNNRGGWRGTSGIQYQTRRFDAIGAEAFVPRFTGSQLGLFTLQEVQLGAVGLEGSIRYDHVGINSQVAGIERSFDAFSAAAGANVGAGDWKFGVNLTRTQRAPAAEELLSDGPHIGTQSYEVGDPDLGLESGWGGELYARYDSTRVNLSATVFATKFSNFIYEAGTGEIEDGLPVFQYRQADATHWGVELQASAHLFHAAGFDFVADGVADYIHAELDDTGEALPRIPPLRLLGGLELQSDKVDLRGEVEWTDTQDRVSAFETPTEGFTLVNASAAFRPWGKARGVTIAAGVRNIFDVDARRHASFTKDFAPLAGRDFRVDVSLSF